LTEESAHKT